MKTSLRTLRLGLVVLALLAGTVRFCAADTAPTAPVDQCEDFSCSR